jgi:hypothetical protein
MSSTELATGPMIASLNKVFDKMKDVDAALWAFGEIGIRPEYLHYGIPDKCSQSMAFSLMLSLGEEYKRKKEMLTLLKEEESIEEAMEKMLALIEAM